MSRLQWRRCDFTGIAIAPRAVLGGCEVELFTFELKAERSGKRSIVRAPLLLEDQRCH